MLLQKSCFQLLLQDIDISHLMCDGIFSNSIITLFFLILTVKKIRNWSIYDEVKGVQKRANFLDHPVLTPLWSRDADIMYRR